MSSAELRRFGPIGILAILLILAGNLLFVSLSALLVLLWARLSETPWRDIGFVRPRSWVVTARGFFFERLRTLLGPERRATIAIVLITAILFGAAHLPDQGLFGAEQATIVGLAFGAIYAITGSLAFADDRARRVRSHRRRDHLLGSRVTNRPRRLLMGP